MRLNYEPKLALTCVDIGFGGRKTSSIVQEYSSSSESLGGAKDFAYSPTVFPSRRSNVSGFDVASGFDFPSGFDSVSDSEFASGLEFVSRVKLLSGPD